MGWGYCWGVFLSLCSHLCSSPHSAPPERKGVEGREKCRTDGTNTSTGLPEVLTQLLHQGT